MKVRVQRRWFHCCRRLDNAPLENSVKNYLARTKGLEPDFEIRQLPQIISGFNKRYRARYLEPSQRWFKADWKASDHGEDKATRLLRPEVFDKFIINSDFHRGNMEQYQKAQKLSFDPAELLRTSLNVGDIVLLKQCTSELTMCVNLPQSTTDPRYTFAKKDGTLVYAMKNSVILRIPKDLPEEVNQLLKRESNHPYQKIGTIKNSSNETEILPVLTRQLIVSFTLATFTKFAWTQLPIVLKKLELIHRYLQDSRGSKHVNFMSLVRIIKNLNIKEATDAINGDAYVRKVIDESMSVVNKSIDPTTLLATYWGVREQQQNNLWGSVYTNTALLSPTTVAVLPLKKAHLFYQEVITRLESNDYQEIKAFAKLVNDKDYHSIAKRYDYIRTLLNDYAAGNIEENAVLTTIISKIFRHIDMYRDQDVTRSLCGKLLVEISPQSNSSNFILGNWDLNIPKSSGISSVEQKLYDTAMPTIVSDTDRYDFGDMPVFCIDSEDAHEIDDGISIEELDGVRSRIHIHIADPAGLFPESFDYTKSGISDDVLRVSLKRAFTTYLPDLVVPMLPKSFCNRADLGKHDRKTETISFSFELVNKEDGGLHVDYDTFQVRLGIVSNFPKVTYDKVDSILNGDDNSLPSKQKKQLELLHTLATKLLHKRIHDDNAVVFGDGFNKGLVSLSPDDDGELCIPTFYDQSQTKSTLLVSEFMILTNKLCAAFFQENKIPGVYRCYNGLNLGNQAKAQFELLKENIKLGKLPSLKDITKISSQLSSSFYSPFPLPHKMIGNTAYLTVTSPMRRGPDLINHLQLHRFLKKLPLCFKQEYLDQYVWSFQARADILKIFQRHSSTYWTLKHLEQSVTKTHDVIVTSVPQNGTVNCLFPEYSYARGTLKLDPAMKKIPRIGDTIRHCKVESIHPLDGILTLTHVNRK